MRFYFLFFKSPNNFIFVIINHKIYIIYIINEKEKRMHVLGERMRAL